MAKAFRSRISGTSDHYDKYRLFMVVEPIGNDYMKHEQIVLHRCESRSFIENRSAFNLATGSGFAVIQNGYEKILTNPIKLS